MFSPALLPPAQLDEHVDNLGIMKLWVSECVLNHEKCIESRQNFLPTRLLDLEAFQESTDIRLVALKPKYSQAGYTTLSHCWGPRSKHPITTKKDILGQRMTRISFDHLSQTFQDAVCITRELAPAISLD